jgi:hypothetical protein
MQAITVSKSAYVKVRQSYQHALIDTILKTSFLPTVILPAAYCGSPDSERLLEPSSQSQSDRPELVPKRSLHPKLFL